MFSFRLILIYTLLLATLSHCKKEDEGTLTAASQTDLLVANNWRVSRITTPDGTDINRSRLGAQTSALYDLNMQFRNDGTVRALDPKQANYVINAGTWTLATDNKSINVVVTGFGGNFPIITLSRSTLTLRQSAPVDGKYTDVNLVFDPII